MLAVLAVLGVPLWLVLGWLAARLWHRHVMKQVPGLFELKVRMISGGYRGVDNDFSRRSSHGLWAHEVLIIESGFMVSHVLHFLATESVQAVQTADPEQVAGLGDSPATVRVKLENGSVIEIAADGDSREKMQGPFAPNTTSTPLG